MSLLAIDPGKKSLAWAFFSGNELASCGLSRFPKDAVTWDLDLGAYATYHARNVPAADLAVIELMFSYPPGPESKLNLKGTLAAANDLIVIQAIACLVAGRAAKEYRLTTAAEWKGQVDKSISRYRVDGMKPDGTKDGPGALGLIEETAAARDLKAVPKSMQHNVYDAIALGLTFLGRLKK